MATTSKRTTTSRARTKKTTAKKVEPKDVELVDEKDVPEGALEDNPDGSVNTYDADGNKEGAIEAETAQKLQEEAGQKLEQNKGDTTEEKEVAVKVKVVIRYLDKVLNQIKDKGEVFTVTKKRAAELEKADVAVIAK